MPDSLVRSRSRSSVDFWLAPETTQDEKRSSAVECSACPFSMCPGMMGPGEERLKRGEHSQREGGGFSIQVPQLRTKQGKVSQKRAKSLGPVLINSIALFTYPKMSRRVHRLRLSRRCRRRTIGSRSSDRRASHRRGGRCRPPPPPERP